MTLDLLLRALRKCVAHSAVIQLHRQLVKHLCGTARQRRVGKATYKICEGYDLLADKIHKKIVARFNHIPLCAICEGLLVGEAIKALELPTEALK